MKTILPIAFLLVTVAAMAARSGADEPTRAHERIVYPTLYPLGHGRGHDASLLARSEAGASREASSVDVGAVAGSVLAHHAPRLATYARGPVVLVPFASRYTVGGALAVRWP